MAATYRVSALPLLYTEGEHKGKLKGIDFTATSANDTQKWFAKNCGHFVAAFSKLMPRSLATVIVASLLHGDEVELPSLFREDQIAGGFHFTWSPVHFVVPPSSFELEFALNDFS